MRKNHRSETVEFFRRHCAPGIERGRRLLANLDRKSVGARRRDMRAMTIIEHRHATGTDIRLYPVHPAGCWFRGV